MSRAGSAHSSEILATLEAEIDEKDERSRHQLTPPMGERRQHDVLPEADDDDITAGTSTVEHMFAKLDSSPTMSGQVQAARLMKADSSTISGKRRIAAERHRNGSGVAAPRSG
jgi:hypothetical protein